MYPISLLYSLCYNALVLLSQNHGGETALHCAAQYGHNQIAKALLDHGADATLPNLKVTANKYCHFLQQIWLHDEVSCV